MLTLPPINSYGLYFKRQRLRHERHVSFPWRKAKRDHGKSEAALQTADREIPLNLTSCCVILFLDTLTFSHNVGFTGGGKKKSLLDTQNIAALQRHGGATKQGWTGKTEMCCYLKLMESYVTQCIQHGYLIWPLQDSITKVEESYAGKAFWGFSLNETAFGCTLLFYLTPEA